MKNKKIIIWYIFSISVAIFIWWYVDDKLKINIYNGYSLSDIKVAVGTRALIVLLPIVLMTEIIKWLRKR